MLLPLSEKDGLSLTRRKPVVSDAPGEAAHSLGARRGDREEGVPGQTSGLGVSKWLWLGLASLAWTWIKARSALRAKEASSAASSSADCGVSSIDVNRGVCFECWGLVVVVVFAEAAGSWSQPVQLQRLIG